VSLFAEKICECINCSKNNEDINSISIVIHSLLNESKYELFTFIKAFLDIFDSVKIYTDNLTDEEGIIKKINLSLFQYKEYFENSYTNKFISFSSFRGLLNSKNIILDDESIEYLIYRMKKDCPNIISRNSKEKEKENNIINDNNDTNIKNENIKKVNEVVNENNKNNDHNKDNNNNNDKNIDNNNDKKLDNNKKDNNKDNNNKDNNINKDNNNIIENNKDKNKNNTEEKKKKNQNNEPSAITNLNEGK
jgi:hypothetical protein